jgi:hypothetical protein
MAPGATIHFGATSLKEYFKGIFKLNYSAQKISETNFLSGVTALPH